MRIGVTHVDAGNANASTVKIIGKTLGTEAVDMNDSPGFGSADHDAEGGRFEGPHDHDAFNGDPFIVVLEGGEFGDGQWDGFRESRGADGRDDFGVNVKVTMGLHINDLGEALDFDEIADLRTRGIGREGDTDTDFLIVDFEGVATQGDKGDNTAQFDRAGLSFYVINSEILN